MREFWRLAYLKRRGRYFYLLVGSIFLMALIGFITIMLNVKPVLAAWYNTNWGYRQTLTLTIPSNASPVSGIDVQVGSINTSTLISAGKLQSNCSDLRFTSGVTGNVLPYFIDTSASYGCNTTTTKVWVRVDQIPANTTTYTLYMYYGNPSATPGTNPTLFYRENGLVGYWPMNETANSWNDTTSEVKDYSVNGNNGTGSGYSGTSSPVSGEYGNAGNFNGSGQYVTASDAELPSGSSTRTISMWVQTSFSYPSGDHYGVAYYYGTANSTQAIYFMMCTESGNSGEVNVFCVSQNGDRVYANSGDTINDGKWHQLVATFDGSTWRMYIDGVQSTTTGVGDHPNMTTNTTLGGTSYIGKDNSTDYFPGLIDDSRIYNRALSSAEIAKLYVNPGADAYIPSSNIGDVIPTVAFGTEQMSPAPDLYYKFDEAQGTTVNSNGPAGSTSNLITNPSFEGSNPSSGWNLQSGTTTGDTTTQVFGTQSLYRTTGGATLTTPFQTYQNVTLSPGTYVFSAYIKTGSWSFGATSVAQIWLNPQGVSIINSSNSSLGQQNQGWRQIWISFSVATQGSYVMNISGQRYGTFNSGDTWNGSWWIDGVQLVQTSVTNLPPTSYCDGSISNGRWTGTPNASTSVCSNNNPGTLSGTTLPTWQTGDQCISGGCLLFNGSTSYVQSSASVSAQTVEFWVKPSSSSASLVGLSPGVDIYASNGTIGTDGITSPTIYINGNQNGTITANNWNYIAITSSSTLNANNITIGQMQRGVLNGFMDEFKIYPYARTAYQILTDYNSRSSSIGAGAVMGVATNNNYSALNNGLVGYWKMDEATWSGTLADVLDSSGNGNNGTAACSGSGCAPPPGGAPGKFGNGGQFNGSTQYVDAGNNSSINISTAYTLSAWINPVSTSGNPMIITKSGGGSTNTQYELRLNGSQLQFVNSNGTSVFYPSAGTINANQWSYVTATFNGNTIVLYINGIQISSTTFSGTPSTYSGNVLIGKRSDGYYFNGFIDEVRIYNRALTPTDVQYLYNYAPGPVAYYNFDQGTGNTVNDMSGYGNNGTWQGTLGHQWVNGKYGKAGSFNGTNRYVTASGNNFKTVSFTISSWVYAIGPPGWQDSAIADIGSYSSNNGFGLWLNTNRYIGWRINNNYSNYKSSIIADIGNWDYFVVTYDGSTVKLYKNGVMITADVYNTNPINASDLSIGARNDGTNMGFNGIIDDVRIYNYAISQKQIISDMNGGASTVSSDPGAIGDWHFDEGYGTIANNSGNGGAALNGTITGATWTENGKFGKALYFNGSSTNYIQTVSAPNLISTHTMSAWIYPTSFSNYKMIFDSQAGNNQYNLFLNSAGHLDSYQTADCISNSVIGSNKWTYVAAVYDGTNIYLYINGNLDNTCAQTEPSTTTSYLDIGGRGSTYNFSGMLDELKLYPYALTASEVQLDYNQGSASTFGVLGTSISDGKTASDSASSAYCVPGDTSACAPPVGEWNFDEKYGGTVNDTSGNGNTGTWNGTGKSHWVHGVEGGAGNFNGVDDYVSSSWNQLTGNASRTIELWFKTTQSANSNWVSWGTNSTNQLSQIGIYNGGIGYLGYANDLTVTDTPYLDKRWHYLVVTFDGGTMNLYIDGSMVNTASMTLNTGTSSLNIGRAITGADYFSGVLDSVRIYNYARTPAQVAWDYNRGEPAGWWQFDECQGNIAYDSSGNGNNGTIVIGSGGSQTALGTCNDGNSTDAWNNGTNGKFNSALSLDGTDDYVNLGNPNIANFVNTVTFSAWVYPKSIPSGAAYIINKWTNGAEDKQLTIDNTGKVDFYMFNTFGGSSLVSNTSLPLNQWSLITGTDDGSTAKIYINGILNNSKSVSGAISNSTGSLYIGGNPSRSSSAYFNGLIDDVRIYEYALTSFQVQLLYNGGSSVRFAPLTGTP